MRELVGSRPIMQCGASVILVNERGERIKNRIVLGGGAVVDDDDLAKICRQQRVYINGKPLVRLQGGNQNA